MNSITPFNLRHAVSVECSPVHDFVGQNWPALQNAASLLGGSSASQEANRLFDDFSSNAKIGPHTQRRLDHLMRLPELDDDAVNDNILLNVVHSSNPIVEEICLLCDGLRHASEQASHICGLL
jgi:hypothetical protein